MKTDEEWMKLCPNGCSWDEPMRLFVRQIQADALRYAAGYCHHGEFRVLMEEANRLDPPHAPTQ